MAAVLKPENALTRAEELKNLGQKKAALQVLHGILTHKRYHAWHQTLEKVMFKHVELCVELRNSSVAKDGLIQFRMVCQHVNQSSLADVVKHFLQLASDRAEQAYSGAQAAGIALDVKDLEAIQRPEELMRICYASDEKRMELCKRESVILWVGFLWEAFWAALEILKNKPKLETLYAMTAHRALQFCLTFKRTTEFHRLCVILRNHFRKLTRFTYRDPHDRRISSSRKPSSCTWTRGEGGH